MTHKNEKTLWIGRIGIPEKYVEKALSKKESLVLSHGMESMEIPYKEIRSKLICYSDSYFKDKFGRGAYRLAYFMWAPPAPMKPLTKEETLRQLSINCL